MTVSSRQVVAITALSVGLIQVFGLSTPSQAADSGDLEPVVATMPRKVLPASPETTVVVAGRRVSALPMLVRVDAPTAHAASDSDRTTVVAYSMNLDLSPFTPTTEWTATSVSTPGISGVRSSSWIAKRAGAIPKGSPEQGRELAARQIAIWHYTNQFAVTVASVPDEAVRDRALQLMHLAAGAPSNIDVSPTSISLSAKIADVETDTVAVTVLVSTNGENSFCGEQKLDVRLFGGWGVIKTGQVSSLRRVAAGRYEPNVESELAGQPCSPSKPAIDYNSARFTFARPDQGTTLEIDWNLTLDGVNVFQASDGSAPLIVGGNPNLEFRQTVAIDPSTFPMADSYLQRFVTSLLRRFHGAFAILILLVLLYAAPWVKQGIDFTLRRTGRAIKRQFERRPVASGASDEEDANS